MPLPIHITPHHLRLSPTLSEFVRGKFAKIPRFASDVIATDIVLRRHKGTDPGVQFSASARLVLAGRDLHASATHADLYTAIVSLVSKLARRARKRKTRLAKSHTPRRSPVSKAPASRPAVHAPDAAPVPSGEQSREINPRNGGQEQRVFAFRRIAPFAFGRT